MFSKSKSNRKDFSMIKKAVALAMLMLFLCSPCFAKDKPVNKEIVIDTNDFYSSKHHWYDIYEAKNVINPEPNQPRYNITQVKEIADNILLYQRDNGGWPKNYDMQAILTKDQKAKVIAAKPVLATTFDNTTTYSHIKYLAEAYEILKDKKYKDAALKGIDFTLSAQYPSGGWPQYYPLTYNYSRYITFNDDAMTGVMDMLKDILDNKSYYSIVEKGRREKVKIAFDKGLDCILKCQIVDNGQLTAWCQQHDPNDLRPAPGRSFELASICGDESANIVLFLMRIDNPSKEVVNSIQSAVKWFQESKITGIRVDEIPAPPVQYPLRLSKIDRVVVKDPNAPPIWARYYELKTRRPLFADRRGLPLYSLAEVDRERRSGYRYYTYGPKSALDAYPAWKAKWASGKK
jgi:PelA/Pel-15E family pectate lyase